MPHSFPLEASVNRAACRLSAFGVVCLVAALLSGCTPQAEEGTKTAGAATTSQSVERSDSIGDVSPETPPKETAEPAEKEDTPAAPSTQPAEETPPVEKTAGPEKSEPKSDEKESAEDNPEEAASGYDGMNLDMTPEEEAQWKKEQEEYRKKQLEQRRKAIEALGEPLIDDVKGLKRLDPFFPVWIDAANKRIVMLGAVAQQRAPLEMFACLRGTKEHESVVVIDTKAFIVHAGLLGLGAEAGPPVKFEPEYTPAGGTEIAIEVRWKDKDGKVQTANAQDWVRNVDTGKALSRDWVFAGSGFWTDEQTGKRYYRAEGGDFICVSNFPSAMLDLPIESTQANSGLMFEAFTENIPPRGTPVTVILTPQLKPEAPQDRKKAGTEEERRRESRKKNRP